MESIRKSFVITLPPLNFFFLISAWRKERENNFISTKHVVTTVWFFFSFFPIHSQYREAFHWLCCLQVTDSGVEDVKSIRKSCLIPHIKSVHQLIIFSD